MLLEPTVGRSIRPIAIEGSEPCEIVTSLAKSTFARGTEPDATAYCSETSQTASENLAKYLR